MFPKLVLQSNPEFFTNGKRIINVPELWLPNKQKSLLDKLILVKKERQIGEKILRLKGGGKKRKKKVYTKPKKIKGIKSKMSLKILEYYELKNGEVLRVKKESPSAPGCMMAEHSNRVTCGKTGLSFLRKG